MTVAQVLQAVDTRYPNGYDQSAKLLHLQRLENMARREIYALPVLVGDLTTTQELAIHTPYDGIYEHYITAMLAQMDGEYTRYNAELGLYAALWSTLSRARRREVLPREGARVSAHA